MSWRKGRERVQGGTIHSWEIPNQIVRYVKANPFVNLEGVWNHLLPCLFRSGWKYQFFQKSGFIRKENHIDFLNHREYGKRGICLVWMRSYRRFEGETCKFVDRIESKGMGFVVMENVNKWSKILHREFQLLVRFRKTCKCCCWYKYSISYFP